MRVRETRLDLDVRGGGNRGYVRVPDGAFAAIRRDRVERAFACVETWRWTPAVAACVVPGGTGAAGQSR
jgi:hypothetical protein